MGKEHFRRTRADAAFTAAQRADARAALRVLEGSGLSLEAAARRAIQGRAALQRVTVDEAVERFLRVKLKRREHTYDWYETRLNVMRATFGARFMDEVSRAEFRAWIAALDVSDGTRANYTRASRALWRWAAAQEPPMAGPSPTEGMDATSSTRGKTPGFLSVAEVRAIMEAAVEWRPALALMLFGGVRVEEVAGKGKPPLTWRQVDVVGKVIHIPAECAKTGKARLIEGLPEAVWAWLGDPREDAEPICPGQAGSAVRWAKRFVKRKWPADALRHTFATYGLALGPGGDRVADWLGHDGGVRLLRAHYAGLARRAEADSYFALRPPETGQ